jgi:hypothetical protein
MARKDEFRVAPDVSGGYVMDEVDAMIAERVEEKNSKRTGVFVLLALVFLFVLGISQCSGIVNNP